MAWINRKKLLAPLLLAAAGGPYLAMEDSWRPAWLKDLSWNNMPAWSQVGGSSSNLPVAALPGEFGFRPHMENPTEPNPLGSEYPTAELSGRKYGSFGDYFRFDLTPAHVLSTWERVTTVLSDTNLEGLRVPLVTGSGVDDLAGSLTYYFDKQHAVQRVTFHGTTGDPHRLVTFFTQTYKLQPQPTLDAGLYIAHWNGQPTSALRIFHAPVVRADQAHSRYEVQIEINRPYVPYQFKLTPPTEQQLRNGQRVNRW